jgi:beta-aspartyl-peptidase (threonine type)
VSASVALGPVLVVHGGAGSLPSEEDRRLYLEGVRGALDVGGTVVEEDSREAVCLAVAFLESETITNSGRGAALAADGSVTLDAGFMEGAHRRYGSVTGVRRCVHPVLLARRLSDEGDFGRFVGPPDADALAEEFGVPACSPEELITERASRLFAERRNAARPSGAGPWLDTVGAVAIDTRGRLAAAVSTGGMSHKRPGRIGDSPVVGGGFWADDKHGACVTTGVGEALMRQGTARRCIQLIMDGHLPVEAARAALAELADLEGDLRGASGLIVVTPRGEVVLDHETFEMSGGWTRPGGETKVSATWCRS